ncbi:hypothetical protein E7T06_10090 [Deinococcus sp. Arct2-2]|uniref:UvrD-helicase domain-containing protein n=1 Tax=Deinococcus sp. Arct2-2 TaxID=2568653 RepID=UPI0010A533DD|nr:UvrD-helicase domain-containing protein [Deinococcus sp. Arct2-2]THF69844.1 hypothetical protein E7T06_10090 [Deinococcus sp. Arct2-2]
MDVVLVDETQDFSRLQHRLVKHVIGRRGRVVLVGDRAQAISEFTGADAGGLDRAQETFNALPLRLTVTFRCPKSHVALASEFSDLIVAAPHAAEGEVSSVSEDEVLSELQPEDLVMARTNAPMISFALRCAQQGLTVEVMGHDLVAKLEGHVTRCFAYPFEVADIEPRLQEYGMALLQDHYEQGVRGKRLRRAMQQDVDLLVCIAALAAEVATRALPTRGTSAASSAPGGRLNGNSETEGGGRTGDGTSRFVLERTRTNREAESTHQAADGPGKRCLPTTALNSVRSAVMLDHSPHPNDQQL